MTELIGVFRDYANAPNNRTDSNLEIQEAIISELSSEALSCMKEPGAHPGGGVYWTAAPPPQTPQNRNLKKTQIL
jgi:hypothetical protein